MTFPPPKTSKILTMQPMVARN